MADSEYFRRQGDRLRTLAQSIKDPDRAQPYLNMAADFHARAEALEREREVPQYPSNSGSSPDGEMDTEL